MRTWIARGFVFAIVAGAGVLWLGTRAPTSWAKASNYVIVLLFGVGGAAVWDGVKWVWPRVREAVRRAAARGPRLRHALKLLWAAARGKPPPSAARDHGGLTADLYKLPGSKRGDIAAGPEPGESYLVWVEPGEFTMGSDDGQDDEGPAHRVRLTRGFWIGQCEVTNEQYAAFLNQLLQEGDATVGSYSAVTSPESEIEFVHNEYRPEPDRANHPAVGVDWRGAMAYAKRYGMDLPTEWEWEYAARGADARVYPWGSKWDPQKCCNRANQGEEWRSDHPEASITRTVPVGSLPEGSSPWGALDMAGNLMEWCKTWYGPYRPSDGISEDPKGPSRGSRRVVRGGNFYYGDDRCRTTDRRHSTRPDYARNSVGFRCVYRPRALKRS